MRTPAPPEVLRGHLAHNFTATMAFQRAVRRRTQRATKQNLGPPQCTACRTGTCLGRDSCHVLLGPHTVGNPNTDTCGDEDILQAQSGDDASTEPPHSDVWLAEAQSSSARLSALHSRSTQGPGPADSRMLQLLPRIVAWREDAPVATPSQSTTPRWSPVFALQLL